MSKGSFKKIIFSLFGVISVGLILGFLYGLGVSISNIFNHNYLYYQLYNLILLDLQYNITKYSIIFILIAFIIIALILFFKKMNPWITGSRITSIKKLYLSIFFIASIIILLGICYFYFVDIVAFLKVSPATEWLGNFTKSKQDTSFIFSAILGLVVLLFILFFAYSIWHRALENVLDNISKRMNSGIIKSLGIAVIGLVIFFNVFMFGYTRLNTPEGPNIILISIDTLRADHLGSYGYERDTSPNMDKLAEEGVLFENAFSQAPWTLPSMASMHTSLYPTQIGLSKFEYRINDKLLTIAEYMRNNFYNTFAVVSNFVTSKFFGFEQGFNQFEETYRLKADKSSSKVTTDKAIRFIQNNKDNKFFLWVHYMDPHGNYINHDEFDYGSEYADSLPSEAGTAQLNKIKDTLDTNDLSYVKNLYDEEISYTDKYIGELINSLSELGIEENTIIILTADHGEEFLERTRFGHGETLYQELIHVPLIIYNPLDTSTIGKRVTNNVEVRYIAKTIFELTNLNNSYIEGYNLLDIDHENSSDGIVYSEQGEKHLKAVLVNDWKLISNSEDNIFELYNLKEDPNERSNQFTSNREDITQVRDMLTAKLLDLNNLKTTEIKKIKLEEEDIKKLKALGYLQ